VTLLIITHTFNHINHNNQLIDYYFFRVDWDNIILKSETFNLQVDFIADYKIDGKILLLPIQGEGKCNISMRKYYNILS